MTFHDNRRVKYMFINDSQETYDETEVSKHGRELIGKYNFQPKW